MERIKIHFLERISALALTDLMYPFGYNRSVGAKNEKVSIRNEIYMILTSLTYRKLQRSCNEFNKAFVAAKIEFLMVYFNEYKSAKSGLS